MFDVKRWWSIFFTVFHFHLFIWWWWWYDSEFCVILSFFLFLIVLQSKQHNSTHFENKMMTAKINDHLVVVVCLFFQSTEYPMNNHYSTNQNKNKTKSVLTKKYIVQNECFIHSFVLLFLHYKNEKQEENHFNMTTYWVFFISKKNIVSYPIPIYTMMMMIVMKPKERKNRIEIILCFISMTIYIVVNINGDNNSILFFVYILGPNKKDAEMVQKRLNDVIFCFHFGYHNHHYHRFVWDVFFVFLLLCMFHLKN